MAASSTMMARPAIPDRPLHGVVRALALVILLFSGLVDLPRSLQVGPVTGQALLTVGYHCAALLLLFMTPVLGFPLPSKAMPLLIFMFWAATSLAWTPALVNGIQNILAVGALPLLLIVGEATASTVPGFTFWLERQLSRSVLLATSLYALSIVLSGPANNDLISARSFGLFALFGVAIYLARWRYGWKSGLWWAIGITLLIGVSESRLALGIAVVLFPIAQIPTRRLIRWAKVLLVSAVVVVLSYAAFDYFDALRDRFLKGDVSLRIGDVSINASGRTAFWRATFDSWSDAPIVGKGAGSAEGLIESVFVTIRHPHSDYLRIAHDYGMIGVVIWTAGILALLLSVWRAWQQADRARHHEARLLLAALLALVAFILEMSMENTMVNVFLTAPLGLILGSAFGSRRSRMHTSEARPAPRPSPMMARAPTRA
jgi:O-antigen ligase